MDLLENIKKLKGIEADKDFTERSRSLILSAGREQNRFSFWQLVFKNLEIGTTLALAGLLILMILGGFSAWKILAPLQLSSLDQASLRAEAQAIDIQIKLAGLNYEEAARAIKSSESTPPTAQRQTRVVGKKQGSEISEKTNNEAVSPMKADVTTTTTTTPTTSSPSTAISIDEALKRLSN